MITTNIIETILNNVGEAEKQTFRYKAWQIQLRKFNNRNDVWSAQVDEQLHGGEISIVVTNEDAKQAMETMCKIIDATPA